MFVRPGLCDPGSPVLVTAEADTQQTRAARAHPSFAEAATCWGPRAGSDPEGPCASSWSVSHGAIWVEFSHVATAGPDDTISKEVAFVRVPAVRLWRPGQWSSNRLTARFEQIPRVFLGQGEMRLCHSHVLSNVSVSKRLHVPAPPNPRATD